MGKFLLSVLLSVSCLSQVYANTSLGGELYYKYVSSLKYEVTIVFYRDCQSAPFGTDLGLYSIQCSSFPKVFNRTAARTSITNVSEYCDTVVSCGTPNTRSNPGIEKHVYKDTLDLTQVSAAVLANCSGTIVLSSNRANRTSSINTGPRGRLYLEATIDLNLAPTNSSPIPKDLRKVKLCCNQPVFTAFGSERMDQGDSISYSLIAPQTSATNTLTYNTPDGQALQVYYPGSLKLPYTNISANPPIGLYFGEESSDLVFTPTNCIQVSPITIRVSEWRKDSLGVPKIVGSFIRERTLSIGNCPDNNPPEIKGSYSYDVCEGQLLCFNIQSDDKQFIPPPPNLPRDPDSVTLSWDQGIPKATFTILHDSARLPTGRFCWRPDSVSARMEPYTFKVTAVDNACPLNSIVVQNFRIRVNKSSTPGTCNLPQTCGSYEVSSKIDSLDSNTNLTYSWWALDSLGSKIADKRIVSFLTTTDVTSSAKSDVVTFSRSGKYILRHEVSNATGTRSEVYFDTIIVAEKTYVKLPNDTTICASEEFDLKPLIEKKHLISYYNWSSYGGPPLQADSVTRITLPALSRESGVRYSLDVYDSNWCRSQDEFVLTTFPESQIGLDSAYNICRKDTLNLQVDSSFYDVLWSRGGDTTLSTEISSAGNFQVQVEDSFGCAYTDSFEVTFFSSLPIDLQDSIVSCGPHEFNFSLLGDYLWKTGDSTNRTTASTTSDIWVVYTDTNGCLSSDTSFVNVVSTPVPVLTRIGDSLFSNQTGTHRWFRHGVEQNGQQSDRIKLIRIGSYTATYIDKYGCESEQSDAVFYTASVIDIETHDIQIYPNPSSGRVMIEGLAIGTIKQVKLFNAQGRVVNSELDISRSTAELRWVSSPGVYVVEVTTDLGIFRKTIIQE